MKNKQTHDYFVSESIFFSELFNPAKETKIIPKLTNIGVKDSGKKRKPIGLLTIVIGYGLMNKRYISPSGFIKDSIKLIIPNNNPIFHRVLNPNIIDVDFIPIFCSMLIGCFSVSFIFSPIIDNNCFILTLWGGYQ
jgi:hypothetical protein